MKKAYMFKSLEQLDILNEKLEKMINNPINYFNFYDVKIEDNYGIDIDDYSFIYLIEDDKLERLLAKFKDVGLDFECFEANKILFNNVVDFNELTNESKENFFSYYKKHFDNDDILDKINERGIKSLNEFDKLILK